MPYIRPKHYAHGDIRKKILNVAQTSVFMVDITSAVRGKPFASGLTFDDQELLKIMCSDASLPGAGMATHEVTGDFSGVTEKMVYRKMFDATLDLTFYVDVNYVVPTYLENWFNYCVGEGYGGSALSKRDYINNNAYYRMNYPHGSQGYKGEIYLVKFEKIGTTTQPTMAYTFVDAYPSNITSTPVSYSGSDVLKYNVSFNYTRYVKGTTVLSGGQSLPVIMSDGGGSRGSGNPAAPQPPAPNRGSDASRKSQGSLTQEERDRNAGEDLRKRVNPDSSFKKNLNKVTPEDRALIKEELNVF